jgi:hypothetical protein
LALPSPLPIHFCFYYSSISGHFSISVSISNHSPYSPYFSSFFICPLGKELSFSSSFFVELSKHLFVHTCGGCACADVLWLLSSLFHNFNPTLPHPNPSFPSFNLLQSLF